MPAIFCPVWEVFIYKLLFIYYIFTTIFDADFIQRNIAHLRCVWSSTKYMINQCTKYNAQLV